MYALVVNTEQPVVKKVLADAVEALETEVGPLRAKVDSDNSEIEKAPQGDGFEEGRKREKELRDKISEIEKEVGDTRSSEEKLIADYAPGAAGGEADHRSGVASEQSAARRGARGVHTSLRVSSLTSAVMSASEPRATRRNSFGFTASCRPR